jgi:hypothetical protein
MANFSTVHATPISFNVNGATTAETVIATTDFLPVNVGGEGYVVQANLNNVLSNASASTLRLRVRQNTLTGTVVADSGALTTAAGANVQTECNGLDGAPAGTAQGPMVYVVTIQAAATAQSQTSTGLLTVNYATSGQQG